MTRSFTLPMSHLQSSTSSPEGTDSLTAESSEIGVRLLDRVSELVEDLGVHPASSDRTVESAKKVTDQLELSIVIPCLNESDTSFDKSSCHQQLPILRPFAIEL